MADEMWSEIIHFGGVPSLLVAFKPGEHPKVSEEFQAFKAMFLGGIVEFKFFGRIKSQVIFEDTKLSSASDLDRHPEPSLLRIAMRWQVTRVPGRSI